MMKDSKVSQQWLSQAMAANPVRALGNGNFLTGPVRLAFPNLFTAQVNKMNPQADPTFNTTLLFPLGADLGPLATEIMRMLNAKWPGTPLDPQGKPYGLHTPFRDQAERAGKFAGFTPGAVFSSANTRYKPPTVDSAMNPIVDEKRVYAGVWAIACVNPYDFDVKTKKGVTLGLQSVMIIQDDEKLGGGASDPRKDFAAVTVTSDVNVDAAFGGVVPQTAIAADDGSDLFG